MQRLCEVVHHRVIAVESHIITVPRITNSTMYGSCLAKAHLLLQVEVERGLLPNEMELLMKLVERIGEWERLTYPFPRPCLLRRLWFRFRRFLNRRFGVPH